MPNFEPMKKFLFTLLMALSFSVLQGQDYQNALGVRGGFSNGLTFKHFLNEKAAVEVLLSTRWRGYNITGLYELHVNAFNEPRLNFYYGIGGHVGRWRGYKGHPWFDDDLYYTVVGIDGILGLEYNFEEVPINISIDYKPAFNLVGYTGFWGDEGALSLRFLF